MKIFIFISLLIVYGNISKGADAEHPADGSSERNSARVMADFPSSLKDVTLAVTVPGSIKLKRIPLSAFRSQLHGLIELNLMGNNIGDPEAIALAGIIPGLPRLESIVLRNNSISDDGAIALVEAFLQLPNLRKVNFQNNPIGDRGATAIARVLPKSGIRKINLYCDIGDDGAIAIAEALRAWPSLQSLNIGENIGKKGVESLAAALPASRLQSFYLENILSADAATKELIARSIMESSTIYDTEDRIIPIEEWAILEERAEKAQERSRLRIKLVAWRKAYLFPPEAWERFFKAHPPTKLMF